MTPLPMWRVEENLAKPGEPADWEYVGTYLARTERGAMRKARRLSELGLRRLSRDLRALPETDERKRPAAD